MKVGVDTKFAMIPEWLLYSEISPQAVRLYAVLARLSYKDDNLVTVGRGTLAKMLHASTDTVDRVLLELEDFGAITVTRKTDEETGRRYPNEYQVHTGSRTSAASNTSMDAATPGGTGAATPSRMDAAEVLETRTKTKPNLAAPRRDELFETVAEVCSVDRETLTPSARGELNRATKELRGVGATPDEVRGRAARYRVKFPGADLTPSALAKHWPKLGGGNGSGVLKDVRPYDHVDWDQVAR